MQLILKYLFPTKKNISICNQFIFIINTNGKCKTIIMIYELILMTKFKKLTNHKLHFVYYTKLEIVRRMCLYQKITIH